MTNRLDFSPLLPVEPDWKAMAKECSEAYFALKRIENAVQLRDVAVDGGSFWQAHNRMEAAASAIHLWSDEPDLYGRLLARDKILTELEEENQRPLSKMCVPCCQKKHSNCKHALCLCPYVCPNVSNNTPHVGCCEQCRAELGV